MLREWRRCCNETKTQYRQSCTIFLSGNYACIADGGALSRCIRG
ncbi:hypothetical protein [Paenibacillus lutimineralis]